MNKDKLFRVFAEITKLNKEIDSMLQEVTSTLKFPDPFISCLHTHYDVVTISVFEREDTLRGMCFVIKEEIEIRSVKYCSEEEVNHCKRVLEKWLGEENDTK